MSIPRKFRFLPVLATMGLIFSLSQIPGNSLSIPLPYHADKIAHAIIYGLLAAACLYALSPVRGSRSSKYTYGAIFLFCIAYGITDEWHQSFVPSRTPSLIDLLADATGAALSLYAGSMLNRRKASAPVNDNEPGATKTGG